MDETRPNPGKPDGDGQGFEQWRAAELQRVVADIAARLRKSCPHLSDEEFSTLVLEIAQRRMRFDQMDPDAGPDRNSQG